MAKNSTPKKSTTKAQVGSGPKVRKSKNTPNVRVKSWTDVTKTISSLFAYNLHDRFTFEYSKQTKAKLVSYGPWLSALFVLVISPQLLTLAQNGRLVSLSGFFNQIFFNQQSWVILVVMLLNVLLLVDGLSDLFDRKLRGWSRVYGASLITLGYVLYQLATNISEPAAPILSLMAAVVAVFSILDIRTYYK